MNSFTHHRTHSKSSMEFFFSLQYQCQAAERGQEEFTVCVFTVVVQAALLHQINQSESISNIADHVLHAKVKPLDVSSCVKIGSKDQFVLELPSDNKLFTSPRKKTKCVAYNLVTCRRFAPSNRDSKINCGGTSSLCSGLIGCSRADLSMS